MKFIRIEKEKKFSESTSFTSDICGDKLLYQYMKNDITIVDSACDVKFKFDWWFE